MATQIKGLDSLISKLNSLGGKAMDALKIAVDETTLAAQTSAKFLVPVITHNLQNNILTEMGMAGEDKYTGVVFDDVEYAMWVELGNNGSKATPFMMGALEENKPTFEKLAEKHLRKAIRKLCK